MTYFKFDSQETYGHFYKDLNLPTKEIFEEFDLNGNEKLTYEEWYQTYQEESKFIHPDL